MKAKTNQTTKFPPQRQRAEDELEWFFGYAESALRHDRVAMLPTYAAARARVSEARPKAQRLARTVLQSLGALPRPHAVVLRAAFTPRSWPRVVHEAFERLAPLVGSSILARYRGRARELLRAALKSYARERGKEPCMAPEVE